MKIRGYRVELGEVEVMLRDHPAVHDAVVVCADHHGDKRLVAYVAPRAGRSVTASDLRAFMQGRAPGYLVPSVFVTIGEVPLTPNGKVDRRALPAPDDARFGAGAPGTPPETPAEQAIARIFGSVLRVDGIGQGRQLLRPRRALAAGHADRGARARRAARGRAVAHAVHVAIRRRVCRSGGRCRDAGRDLDSTGHSPC